jgi:RNA polymerase primary sigma factor
MKGMQRVPLLTPDEEIILGGQVQKMMQLLSENGMAEDVSATNVSELLGNPEISKHDKKTIKIGVKARDRMISANMRLVAVVAQKHNVRQTHMTLQDLIQEGMIGLARAVEKYEPTRGYKFSTYAYWWIRQRITRAIEHQEGAIRVPAHIQRMIRDISTAKAKLRLKLGREPLFAEIGEAIGELNQEKIRTALMSAPSVFSLDFLHTSTGKMPDGTGSLYDIIPSDDESEVNEKEQDSVLLDFVMMALNALPESEQLLIRQKYGINAKQLSSKEIAVGKGITPQAIRDRQKNILNRMRFVVSSFQPPDS